MCTSGIRSVPNWYIANARQQLEDAPHHTYFLPDTKMAEKYSSTPTAASDEATPPAYSDHSNYPEPPSVSMPTSSTRTEEGVKINVTHIGSAPPPFSTKPIPLLRRIPRHEIPSEFLPNTTTKEEVAKEIQKMKDKEKKSGGFF